MILMKLEYKNLVLPLIYFCVLTKYGPIVIQNKEISFYLLKNLVIGRNNLIPELKHDNFSFMIP